MIRRWCGSAASRVTVLCLMIGLLAGCKTNAEKAAELVRQGAASAQSADPDAALKAFRQALALDPESTEALRGLADLNLNLDRIEDAKKQYIALLERLPQDIDANQSMAEIALSEIDTETAAAYASVPMAKAHEDARTKGIGIALEFYLADLAGDDAGRQAALNKAQDLVAVSPEIIAASRILIQSLMNGPDPGAALPMIEAALADRPKSLELNMMKLNVLSRVGDGAAGADQLKAMYRDFPDNTDVQAWLTEWYLGAGGPDETVSFLRDLAARHKDDPLEHEAIADYVEKTFPADAAAGELDRIANLYDADQIADLYRARAAGVRFAGGKFDEAIAGMQALLKPGRPLAASAGHRTILAGMLNDVGRRPDAQKIIDSVLADNPNQIDAQKLRARWLMQDDDTSGAISALREALSAARDDPELLTMIAEAYESSGSEGLAGSSLADAVSVSGNGVRETILFVRFLLRTGNPSVAAETLSKSLEVHPGDAALLALAREAGITAAPAENN
jgi:cellulose synthase operon protein C